VTSPDFTLGESAPLKCHRNSGVTFSYLSGIESATYGKKGRLATNTFAGISTKTNPMWHLLPRLQRSLVRKMECGAASRTRIAYSSASHCHKSAGQFCGPLNDRGDGRNLLNRRGGHMGETRGLWSALQSESIYVTTGASRFDKPRNTGH
jgi:hypothetical protein